MKITHEIKFNINRDYEMAQMAFEITDEDLTDDEKDLSLQKRFILMQKRLIKQGYVFKALVGYITPDDLKQLLKKLDAD